MTGLGGSVVFPLVQTVVQMPTTWTKRRENGGDSESDSPGAETSREQFGAEFSFPCLAANGEVHVSECAHLHIPSWYVLLI